MADVSWTQTPVPAGNTPVDRVHAAAVPGSRAATLAACRAALLDRRRGPAPVTTVPARVGDGATRSAVTVATRSALRTWCAAETGSIVTER
ncbi:MAG: hypothetical protein H6733_11480 [Alphaproteobacteria bacterium]|nr:hypothetical protein [Alphaproteobacteria bacterium]